MQKIRAYSQAFGDHKLPRLDHSGPEVGEKKQQRSTTVLKASGFILQEMTKAPCSQAAVTLLKFHFGFVEKAND